MSASIDKCACIYEIHKCIHLCIHLYIYVAMYLHIHVNNYECMARDQFRNLWVENKLSLCLRKYQNIATGRHFLVRPGEAQLGKPGLMAYLMLYELESIYAII